MLIRSSHIALRTFITLAAALVAWISAERAESKDVAGGKVTYSKHIAAILWKNCAACHRPGEVGPFSLLTYEDASKRADFLAEITADRRMPPWKAEPNFGKFRDERRLSDREIELIAKWAEAGAPEGDFNDLPKPPRFPEGWQLGEPDMVLKMSEPFEVPAGGRDVYRCFVIPIPIENNKMVSGVEFRPGNPKVVHHAIMFLDANGAARRRDGVDGKPGFKSFGGPGIRPTGGLGGWTPGTMPRFLPEGLVKYVKQGSDLVLQVHYHPIGKAESDQSIVGVHFSKKPVSKIVTGIAVMQTGLKIPAGDAHCEITAQSQPLPVNVNVLGLSPHMHNLGREFKVTAKLPGGAGEVPLIWIKDWDFNWQGAYQFEKPIRLPKGATINVSSIYDNSAANPKNPHSPPKAIHWGEQTTDEMCLCGVQVFADKSADLKQIAEMRGNELGAGLDGGIPGQAESVKQKAATKKTADKKQAAKEETAKKLADKKEAKQQHVEEMLAAKSAKTRPAVKKTADAESAETEDAETQPPVKEAAKPEPAVKKAAKPAKNKSAFPAAGYAIPEKLKIVLNQFDTDHDGKISRGEFDKMPDVWKTQIRNGLLRLVEENRLGEALRGGARGPADDAKEKATPKTPAAKKEPAQQEAAESPADEDDEPQEEAAPKAVKKTAKTPAAKKESAKQELAEPPADEDDEPQEEAAPKAVKKTAKTEAAAKGAAKADAPFPAEGYTIPEKLKILLNQFDTDHDGKISRGEFAKLPDVWKTQLRKGFPRPPGGSESGAGLGGAARRPPDDTKKKATAKTTAAKKEAAKQEPAESMADEDDEPEPEAAPKAAKPTAKTRAAKKESAKKEAAKPPADEDDDEPQPATAPKEAKPAAEAAAKGAAQEDPPFPPEGYTIPEKAKILLSQYDKNGDGKLSKEEFAKISPQLQKLIRRNLKPQ